MSHNQQLRNQLVRHIEGGEAFLPIDNVLENVSFGQIRIVPYGIPYSFYQQFYHIRMALLDILEYCRNDNYQPPNWPDDYWPNQSGPADEEEWKKLVDDYFSEREEFCDYLLDPSNDLFEPVNSNPDHTLLREAQLIIEHTAYHIGQLQIINRLLNN